MWKKVWWINYSNWLSKVLFFLPWLNFFFKIDGHLNLINISVEIFAKFLWTLLLQQYSSYRSTAFYIIKLALKSLRYWIWAALIIGFKFYQVLIFIKISINIIHTLVSIQYSSFQAQPLYKSELCVNYQTIICFEFIENKSRHLQKFNFF